MEMRRIVFPFPRSCPARVSARATRVDREKNATARIDNRAVLVRRRPLYLDAPGGQLLGVLRARLLSDVATRAEARPRTLAAGSPRDTIPFGSSTSVRSLVPRGSEGRAPACATDERSARSPPSYTISR